MARRRRSSQVQWQGEERDASLNGMFESMRDKAQLDLQSDISIGTESEANLVGLPLPALCLRYMFQSSTFPLSRIIQITGEEGSAKSAFLYEIFRWHMVYGGGAVLAENENKDSPELRQSILQWNQQWLQRMVVKSTYAMEGWQDVFTKFIDLARDQQDNADGPGRTVPICFGCDSLMATAPQAEIDAVRKEGHSMRGYALAANLIARYMRTMPERIKHYPFTMAGTNHLKPGTDMRGLPTAAIPGGKAVKFMETYEVEMKRAHGGHDIDKLEYGGLRLKLTARKNSLGPSRKSITAELLWWYEDLGNGEFKQQTAWDWDTATVEMLLSFENAKGKKTIYNRLMEICGLKIASKSQRTAYSTILGIPKSDPQLYRVVGAAIEQRPDILTQLYQVLGVTARRPFQPGVDYQDLLATAREEAQAEAADLYEDVESLPVLGDSLTTEGDVTPEDGEAPTSESRADAATDAPHPEQPGDASDA